MRRARALTLLALLSVFLPALSGPAAAQGRRDSLRAGAAAYDRADFATAARLLAVGLDPAAGPRDSVWANGVHKLADALLQTGDSTTVALWLAWAHQVAPTFPIDTLLFPPRVTGVIRAARREARPTAADSLVVTTWEFGVADSTRRGALRLGRAAGFAFGVLENVGTILPEERRTLPAGTYTVTLTVDGAAPIRVTRAVLPGVTTIVTPNPQAIAAARPAVRVDSSAGFEARLSAGGGASCLIGTAALCWGSNAAGVLGGGWTDPARGPVVVAGTQRFTTITVGTAHACGLTAAGAVYCWGANAAGQLGTGTTTASAVPVAISGNQSFTAIAAGAQHTCGITRTGSVFCWGANGSGQLGNRGTVNSPSPAGVLTPNGAVATAIAAGGNHTCAVTARGAFCWGSGAAGELGGGGNRDADRPVPIVLPGGDTLRSIVAGAAHSCGLLTSGRVVCWGSNANGQLGNGTTQSAARPQPISDTTAFASLAAGDDFTCGITTGGATWCWGAGGSGQLGNGRTADSPRPSLVVGGLNFRALAAGAAHTCAVIGDGTVWCWGRNDAGQVGSLAERSSPQPVPFVVRPAPRSAPVGMQARHDARDNFDDNNLTAGVVWGIDSVPGAVVRADSGQLVVRRSEARGAVAPVGVGVSVRLPARNAPLRFDVKVVRNATPGCGLNCTAWPAIVRVRVRNRDFTRSEVWYVYGAPAGAHGWSASGITIVPMAATPGEWLRHQTVNVLEAAPRADSIVEVWLGGIGTDFESRFDNLVLPAVPVARVVVRPDTARFTRAGDTLRVAAEPRDADSTALRWTAVTWSSSDTAVARVDSTGLVTAVGNGTAQIRAAAEDVTGVVRVTVRLAPVPRARPTRPTRRPTRPSGQRP